MIETELDLDQARIWIFCQALFPDPRRAVVFFLRSGVHVNVVSTKIIVVLAEVRGVLAPSFAILALLDLALLSRHRVNNFCRHFVLKREGVLPGLVIALGPHMLPCPRVDELGGNANLVCVLPDAALESIVDVEIAADLANVDGFAFVSEGRVARDHREIGKTRQHGDDVLAHPVAQIAESLIRAQVVEWQYCNGWHMGGDRRERRRPHYAVPGDGCASEHENDGCENRHRPSWHSGLEVLAPCRKGSAIDLHAIDRDWFADVLDLLVSHRLKTEREFLFNFLRHLAGNADAAPVGKLLEPGGDVDAFAMPVGSLHDHFAKVNSDPNIDAAVLELAGVSLRHSALDIDGALDRVVDAPEFNQQPIAHELEDAAVVGRYLRPDEFNAVILQALEGLRFVLLHYPAVADNISGKNGGERAFHERDPLANPILC